MSAIDCPADEETGLASYLTDEEMGQLASYLTDEEMTRAWEQALIDSGKDATQIRGIGPREDVTPARIWSKPHGLLWSDGTDVPSNSPASRVEGSRQSDNSDAPRVDSYGDFSDLPGLATLLDKGNSRHNPNPTSTHTYDDDFMSTRSVISNTTFYTALSGVGAHGSNKLGRRLKDDSNYAQLLAKKSLWPVDPMVEQDWSGRGQHAEFKKDERMAIHDILDVQDVLGRGSFATVESVKCRRILLARKTIFCDRHFTKDQAVEEVAHLTRLTHAHIVRIVGTYVLGKELSILIYPVAEYNLEKFLRTIRDGSATIIRWVDMVVSAIGFFSCLTSAVRHIHGNLTKHMDIKPQNVLVRRVANTTFATHNTLTQPQRYSYKVYIADFGIARSYDSKDAINTDGAITFTKKYAPPEVVEQHTRGLPRGLPADIFSLGCVFLEMFAILSDVDAELYDRMGGSTVNVEILRSMVACSRSRVSFHHLLEKCLKSRTDADGSYQANIDTLQAGVSYFHIHLRGSCMLTRENLAVITRMINRDPALRPTAEQLQSHYGERMCCGDGSDRLEAMVMTSEDMDLDVDTLWVHDVRMEESTETDDEKNEFPRLLYMGLGPGERQERMIKNLYSSVGALGKS